MNFPFLVPHTTRFSSLWNSRHLFLSDSIMTFDCESSAVIPSESPVAIFSRRRSRRPVCAANPRVLTAVQRTVSRVHEVKKINDYLTETSACGLIVIEISKLNISWHKSNETVL